MTRRRYGRRGPALYGVFNHRGERLFDARRVPYQWSDKTGVGFTSRRLAELFVERHLFLAKVAGHVTVKKIAG